MRTILPANRKQLLSASGLAVATALAAWAPVAQAQSFQGSVTSTFGTVSIGTTATTTDITISSPTAVINWTPNDTASTGGPIDFQPVGTTATFINDSASTSDFTVLNRIVPSGSTRPIQFNGSVVSRLQSAAGGQVPGGTVFFYSPGGLLIGSSAVFDVGNLVLTTSDLPYDAAGNFQTGGAYVFQQATVAGSQVVVQPGAQINASTDGSYVALVAPVVSNGGTITVNGSAALVAADAATITFSPSGLFDITVDSGTSGTGTPISNNGTITGPAASTFFHRIYMVAVPKNDAITMAIGAGSSLGFDIAGAADMVGNSIVLSAGGNVLGGSAQTGTAAGGGTGLVSINGADADFTSSLEARATGSVQLGSASSQGLDFASSVFVQAGGASSIYAAAGGSVTIGGNLSFGADASASTGTATAGSVGLDAFDGGQINVAGSVFLSANAYGAPAFGVGETSGDAVAGSTRVLAQNGGQITISGDLQLVASGYGGSPQVGGAAGGAGYGGNALVQSFGTGGAAINVLGSVDIEAAGFGGNGTGCVTCLTDGGLADAGSLVFVADGTNQISVGGATAIRLQAVGGSGIAGPGGSAIGGQVDMSAHNGAQISLGQITVDAGGNGGGSIVQAGEGRGGSIAIAAFDAGSSLAIAGNASLLAQGFGGQGNEVGAIGGDGVGGSINFEAQSGSQASVNGVLEANAIGSGGGGYAGSLAGTGGSVVLRASGGGLLSVTSNAVLIGQGQGGVAFGSAAGGLGTGGSTLLSAESGAIQLGGDILMTSNGIGGSQAESGAGGAGAGGDTRWRTIGTGQITVAGGATVTANGIGGSAGLSVGLAGGSGTGGAAYLDMAGGQSTVGGNFELSAEGSGGTGGTTSGQGTGGSVVVTIADATLGITGSSRFSASGVGGAGSTGVAAGLGQGGTLSFTADNSTVVLAQSGDAVLEASGKGGQGGTGGDGFGGLLSVNANAASISATSGLSVNAEGYGGFASDLGNGGSGRGGAVVLAANGDARGLSDISASSLLVSASGRGGDGSGGGLSAETGGSGGAGQGGSVALNAAADGGTISAGFLSVQAAASGGFGGIGGSSTSAGGQGGNGGSAIGGTVAFNTNKGAGTGTGGYIVGQATVDASAAGGMGADGGTGFAQGPGGNGGSATGGAITFAFDQGGSSLQADGGLDLRSDAWGGNAGNCAIGCLAAGGAAVAGSIAFGSNGLTTGNLIAAGGLVSLSAQASGGGSYGVSGGNATGGFVQVKLDSGLAFEAGGVTLTVSARGGDEFTNVIGGAGQGGTAEFIASGTSTASILDTINITADGTGGNGRDIGASGGAGTGGTSRLYSNGGAITVTGGAVVHAGGFGGDGNQNSNSGAGGNGTGGGAFLTVGTPTALGNGGSISIAGQTYVTASGEGGDAWAAGTGTGGFVGVSARDGTLGLDTLFATASAFGGYGLSGGAGGSATGGEIQIFANSAVEGASLVTINSLNADASAFGGFGSDAAIPGDIGGAGGAAQGGSIQIFGTAGNGRMEVGSVTGYASASGGGGGLGGDGGAGGAAIGGLLQLGIASGFDTGTINTGSALYGSINLTAGASGGNGGAGGQGSATSGSGGAGGAAQGGGVTVLVRGASMTVTGATNAFVNAIGGNGGSGPVVGAGGDATIGSAGATNQVSGASLTVTNRFNQPAQTGSLTAGDLNFSALAVGGTGSTAGIASIAGDAVDLDMVSGTLNAASLSLSASADSVAAGAPADFISLLNSTANISGALFFETPNAFSLTLDQSFLTADNVVIGAGNWVLGASAPTNTGLLTGTNGISLSSGQDIVAYANLNTLAGLSILAPGRIDLGALTAGGFIDLTAGGSITIGDASAGESIDLDAIAAIATGNLVAQTSITARSQGSISTGNLSAGTGTPTGANGDLNTIALTAGGNVTVGAVNAASDIGISAGGTISTGALQGYDMLVLGGSNITLASLNAVNRVLIADVSMTALGQTATVFDKELVFAAPAVATNGAIGINGTSTANTIRGATNGTVTTAAISAPGSIGFTSGGNATFANLSSGGRIELLSSGTLNLASANTGSDVTASGALGLTVGTIFARDVALLSGGNIAVQQVLGGLVIDPVTNAVTNATGRIILANSSMLASTATPGAIDYNALFAAAPVANGGTTTVNTAVGGSVLSASTGAMSGRSLVGFGSVDVTSGGLVTVQEQWGGNSITIRSADISIIDNGTATSPTGGQILSGLKTLESGSVDLISTANSPALIGDGLFGSGYALGNTEIGLISTGRLLVAATDVAGNATDMLIGNLSLTAGGTAGNSIATGTAGRIIFATGDLQTQIPGGAIRITGTISGTGFAATNALEFDTGRFELDAATGGISLVSSGTTLGGVVEVNAANIHVASGAILDRLAADPFYAGHANDLNAPAAVQRPAGVLRALGLELSPTGTLYIQNTGTTVDPAGFFSDFDLTDVIAPANATPGSISVIVNGRFQTANGVVSGVAAHNLVVANATSLAAFTADSQINGCLFSVSTCAVAPPPPSSDPAPAISSQIEMISTGTLGDTPGFDETPGAPGSDDEQSDAPGQKEEEGSGDDAASPIAPPPQIINSQSLDPQSQIEQPVAGSGNPSLIGSVVNENSAEGEGQ